MASLSLEWLVKRIARIVFTVFVVLTLSFAIIQKLPGGPLSYLKTEIARRGGDPSQVETLASSFLAFDPTQPLHVQYLTYVTNLAQGDFGTSTVFNEPVIDILMGALPWTIFVMSLALFLSFGIGIASGAFLAYNSGSRSDILGSVVATVLDSIPFYIAGIILLFVFGYQLEFVPTSGRFGSNVTIGFNADFFVSALYHAILPVLSVALVQFGSWTISMRANSIQVLGTDYLRVARLRGLGERRIVMRYVARNSILPLYTRLLIAMGYMFNGAVILERIFQYPGVGFYIVDAINRQDYPLMLGGFILVSTALVVSLTFADATYAMIDPRAAGENQ